MGMYDEISVPPETKCVKCGEPITGFQSKDGPCELKVLDYSEVDNFYTDCEACGHWNEYVRKRPKPKVPFEDFEIRPNTRTYDL
ncbi:hypothetical protein VDG1235_2602 [Verrucomicrobiia bacterium DG1235]|nr:hypothetical protein VDG1235_2602 [Verrucomicrobiae bacterium DG1235]